MLSDQLKVIFIHIPKTAGQSIEQCFLQHHGISWQSRSALLLRENPDPAKGPPRLAHLTASEYVSHGYISPNEFTDYFKFSFVRNPWARLVSEYKWRAYHRKWSFKDWLNNAFPEPDWTDNWCHVMPQYDYLFDSDGNCLVDFIGHFESLKDDFNLVREQIGEQLPELPHVNQSLTKCRGIQAFVSLQLIRQLWLSLKSKEQFHTSYLEYYDRQTWAWVTERYKKDIDIFGYADQISKF